ncbi:MAG: PIN domain-containing protein [Egibacteraceae bacterium]
MDAVLDSGALTAWASRRPPAQLLELLEVVAASGGIVIVPTVTVVESTTGRQPEDASVNHRLRRAFPDPCTLERARQAAKLRFRCDREVSAVDAVVAATTAERGHAVVATSDPDDLQALLAPAGARHPVIRV